MIGETLTDEVGVVEVGLHGGSMVAAEAAGLDGEILEPLLDH